MRDVRALGLLLGAAILVAGCAGGAGTTPSATVAADAGDTPASVTVAPEDPAPTTAAGEPVPTAVAPAAAATSAPTRVNARVTFDGTHCVYTGPTVIPSPAVLTIEYAPAPGYDDSIQFIAAQRHGTTEAEMDELDDDPSAPAVGDAAPEWALEESIHVQQGPGTTSSDVHVWRLLTGAVYDQYIVSCAPSMSGRPIKGEHTILQLVETAAP